MANRLLRSTTQSRASPRSYKAEYHRVDELRGAPTTPSTGLDEEAPPVLVSGGFHHRTR